MGRPRLIADEAILAAAREVFLAQGAAATTQAVALRAGLSQAAIFKRFPTKQELFLAAMAGGKERQDVIDRFQQRAKSHGIRRALVGLGDGLLPLFRQKLPLLLLSWSNRAEFGFPKAMSGGSYPPTRAVREVVAFLEGEMRARRLRKHDPWLVTRAFVGSLQHYVLMELLSKGADLPIPALSPKEFVRGLVELLWKGVAPLKEQE
jgi:AcrR family transcriptional regulator